MKDMKITPLLFCPWLELEGLVVSLRIVSRIRIWRFFFLVTPRTISHIDFSWCLSSLTHHAVPFARPHFPSYITWESELFKKLPSKIPSAQGLQGHSGPSILVTCLGKHTSLQTSYSSSQSGDSLNSLYGLVCMCSSVCVSFVTDISYRIL